VVRKKRRSAKKRRGVVGERMTTAPAGARHTPKFCIPVGVVRVVPALLRWWNRVVVVLQCVETCRYLDVTMW
jgi:hypothetical protein